MTEKETPEDMTLRGYVRAKFRITLRAQRNKAGQTTTESKILDKFLLRLLRE